MLKTYYLNTLARNESDAYYAIDSAIRAYRSECMLYGISVNEIEKILEAYMIDNPDVWHCCFQFCKTVSDARGTRVKFTYNEFDEARFREQLNRILDRIDRTVGTYADEKRIAKVVYDYLAENVEADTDAMDAFMRLDRNSETAVLEFIRKHSASFCAYGAIVNGKAVCMGLSHAYKLILDSYRVEATSVTGLYDQIPHMMNVLELNGDRVYVDVSKGGKQEALPMIRYDAFLVGENRIRRYFEPNHDLNCLPYSPYCYFSENGLEFKNGTQLRQYLGSFTYAKTNGDVRFLYSGNVFDDDDLEKMIGDIVCARCGSEYRVIGYVAQNGIANCKIAKRD